MKALVDQESIIAQPVETTVVSVAPLTETITSQIPKELPSQLSVPETMQIQQPISSVPIPQQTAVVDNQILANIEGVQCYAILGQGKQLLTEGCLRILKSNNGTKSLQLGSVQFPLSQSTPCLKTSNGNYIIPMNENVFYGFVFPSIIPEIYLRMFESLLSDACPFRVQPQQPKPVEVQAQVPNSTPTPTPTTTASVPSELKKNDSISEKISNGIQTGTTYLVSGIGKTATVVSNGLSKYV